METLVDEVSMRCMGCRRAATLRDAVRDDWRMCSSCNFFICAFCREHLGDPRYCLSPLCSAAPRRFEEAAIPTERILIYAERNYAHGYRQGLLYNLFFAEAASRETPFTLVRRAGPGTPALPPPTVAEEVWRNHALVLTKRRGGKFVTWEKVL